MLRRPLLCVLCLLCALSAQAQEKPAESALKKIEETHVAIFKRLSPAVVGITCLGPSRAGMMGSFYGTGAVVSADGLVLTDITVIPKGGKDAKVYFADGRVMEADIKQIDAPTEGVLLKVKASGLPFMKLADSVQVRVGDPCYSWGNPFFSIQRDGMVSLSFGAVSGIYQVSSVDDQSRYIGPVIETDAAVNPGSDGGPLTDAEGNLLGIMSLAFSRSRWLGLAIPTAHLRVAMPELKALPVEPRPASLDSAGSVWRGPLHLAKAAEAVAKATVAVRPVGAKEKDPPATRSQESVEKLTPYPDGPPRLRFESKRPAGACASGVVVEPGGIVITAATNVAGADRVFVYLADGKRVKAAVLGQDDALDIAVLKLEGDGPFESVPLGAEGAKAVAIGQPVAVLGRSEPPGGLTLNGGIVSALGRYTTTSLQASAFVNYGNLGGPAVNAKGELVGIANHLGEKSEWRQNCGVGFVLRADRIAAALPDLKAGRKLAKPTRAVLGIHADMGALDVKGIRVNRFMKDSPAQAAGMKEGDVIVELHGKPVADMTDLREAMRQVQAGQVVKIKVKRKGATVDLDVKVGESSE